MEQDLATQSLSDPEATKLLWERWMHLERLLIATLFAMFITTTVGLFTAAGKIQVNASARSSLDTFLLLAAGAVYGLLAGYYYFMLAQNYAAIISLLRMNRQVLSKMSALWGVFKPRTGPVGNVMHQVILVPAAVVPLLITSLSLLGLKFVLRNEHPMSFWAPLCVHVILFFAMIWLPFRQFVDTLRELTAQPDAPLDVDKQHR
jgi:hypothetical protein